MPHWVKHGNGDAERQFKNDTVQNVAISRILHSESRIGLYNAATSLPLLLADAPEQPHRSHFYWRTPLSGHIAATFISGRH